MKLRTITVADAEAWLEVNKNSYKHPHKRQVERLAAEIRAGRWRVSDDLIVIAKNGDVINGRHRLQACIDADTPIEAVVVRGEDK